MQAFELTLIHRLSRWFRPFSLGRGNALSRISRVGEHIASRKWLAFDGPDHRLDGTRFVCSRRRLGLVAHKDS